MVLRNSNYPFSVEFEYGFPDIRGMNDGELYQDTFNIIADESVGSVSGRYSLVRRGDIVRIELSPSGGWTPIANSLLTKMIFGRHSVFCRWPKTYRYIQEININTLESISHWERVK